MIQIVQGFRVSTRDAVDNRILLSKEEMKLVNDNQMPEKYFAVCKDDCMLYMYDKSRVANDETGKFVMYSASAIESISIDGVEIPIIDKNVDLPKATADRYGMIITGRGLKSENGVVTLDFNSLDDHAIPFEKVDFSDVVIDASNISII